MLGGQCGRDRCDAVVSRLPHGCFGWAARIVSMALSLCHGGPPGTSVCHAAVTRVRRAPVASAMELCHPPPAAGVMTPTPGRRRWHLMAQLREGVRVARHGAAPLAGLQNGPAGLARWLVPRRGEGLGGRGVLSRFAEGAGESVKVRPMADARLSRLPSSQVGAYAGFVSRSTFYPAAGEPASFSPFLVLGLGSTVCQWLARSSCARLSAVSAASVAGRWRKS